MESFSLLKYWRTTSTNTSSTTTYSRATTPNTILSAASPLSSSDQEEEGPYFDLQFSLQDDNDTHEQEEDQTDSSTECVSLNEEDLKLTLETTTNGNECAEEDLQNVKISASDELFFKENLVSIEENSNKIPLSLLKSATKFRVLLLKLKKSKSGNGEKEKPEGKEKHSSKFFTVKLKLVEEVKAPIVSYFTRDNSSKLPKNQTEDSHDEKIKLTKEVVQKYLNMVKPLYVRASKRYVEKLKFSGGRSGGGEASPPSDVAAEIPVEAEVTSCVRTNLKQGNNNLQAGLKVVRKHLGKSRSASATVPPAVVPVKVVPDRRDDSLLQVQDGIQGAILHCKRSFNGSRDGEGSSSMLSRSVSDQSYDKSAMMGTVSSAATSSYSGEPKQIIKV